MVFIVRMPPKEHLDLKPATMAMTTREISAPIVVSWLAVGMEFYGPTSSQVSLVMKPEMTVMGSSTMAVSPIVDSLPCPDAVTGNCSSVKPAMTGIETTMTAAATAAKKPAAVMESSGPI